MKTEYITHMGDDDMIVDAARVSLDKRHDQYTEEQNAKLIKYLATHDHFTPFCHPQIQFRITAPIFVARQWFRSTVGVARNERSMRYVDETPTFFTPEEWRSRPDGSIKQGSGDHLTPPKSGEVRWTYNEAINASRKSYESLLALGVAPEQARMVLPQSMETQWLETGSLAYFARICRQRLDSHAQVEIQNLAQQVADIIQPLFPVAWDTLINDHQPE